MLSCSVILMWSIGSEMGAQDLNSIQERHHQTLLDYLYKKATIPISNKRTTVRSYN